MSSLDGARSNRRGRLRRVSDSNEAEDSTYGTNKRENSPSTKQRVAESNARHNDLQKQRNNELKELIPGALLEEAKNVQGSNRALIHTLNAAKLYIANLLEDKKQLQEELGRAHGQPVRIGIAPDDDSESTEGTFFPRSHGKQLGGIHARTGNPPTSGTPKAVDGPKLKVGYGRASNQEASVEDHEGKLPTTLSADISPHDSLLRQAVERFIALTKEHVISSEGVLGKEQIDRLNAVHDFIVDMVNDINKG